MPFFFFFSGNTKSGNFAMAITVAISDPALFQQAVPKTLPAPTNSGIITISAKKLKKLEGGGGGGGGGRINANWVDSMRASSPTRRSLETDEHKSWIVS